MKLLFLIGTLCIYSGPIWSQGQFTGPSETFLELVDPLITKGEKNIYQSLTDYGDRDYFVSIFWYKRDPHPEKAGNLFKKNYFERRQQAASRFAERGISGTRTDRGRVFLLMGEPDKVVQDTVMGSSLGNGIEEKWIYTEENRSFSFLIEIGGTRYRLIEPTDLTVFEDLKESLILDRAEPFRLNSMPLSIPNIGATKDIENLVVKDRHDLDVAISYSCFKSSGYQSEVFVGVTVNDGSPNGYELNLAAFDPYENKVIDIKKKIKAEQGHFVGFPVALDPDQYQIVLRILDQDGRLTVDRRYLDVPDFKNLSSQFSGVVWGDSLTSIPVEGFQTDKRFVYKNKYLHVQNQIRNNSELYVMLEAYSIESDSFKVYVNDRVVSEKPVIIKETEKGTRNLLFKVPKSDWGDFFEIKVVGGSDSQKFAKSFYLIDGKPVTQAQMIEFFSVFPDDSSFKWLLPTSDRIEELSMIAIKPPADVHPVSMFVYQNHRLIAQKANAPWQVEISEGMVNVSGNNEFTVIFNTDKGPRYLSRTFKPLRIDQTIKSRAVNVFFNGYLTDNSFVQDLDLSKLSVKVDGKPAEPISMRKEESPITYLFLIDNSYSMKDSFVGNIRAIKKFISMMRPVDSGFFVVFSSNYFQLNKPTRSKEVLKAVADSIRLEKLNPRSSDRLYRENETYVYDAAIAGIHALIAYPGRKAAIIVSDGISIEGVFTPHALISYAHQNEVVIHSLWLDNNTKVSADEFAFLRREVGRGERFARAVGLSRFFAKKDTRKNQTGMKIKKASITEGTLKGIAEESGGFHYRIFKADRSFIQAYIDDIEKAMGSQYQLTLMLPVSNEKQEVELSYPDPKISFRLKSVIKVRKTNPLSE
jgi:GWxTD domain-containing protein